MATGLALAAAGVPTVDTVGLLPDVAGLAMSAGDAEPDLPPGTGVVKPARGHRWRSGDPGRRWWAAVGAFWQAMRSRATTTAVEAVVAQPLVVGDAMSAPTWWRVSWRALRRRPGRMWSGGANARLGAIICEPLPLSHPGADLAVRAVAALGWTLGRVDLIGPDDDLRVLEVDGWAGFDHLDAVTGADVPGRISAYSQGRGRKAGPRRR